MKDGQAASAPLCLAIRVRMLRQPLLADQMRVPRVVHPKHTRASCVCYWGLPIRPRGWRECSVPSDEVRLIVKGLWPMQAHRISEECIGGCVIVISRRPTTRETSPAEQGNWIDAGGFIVWWVGRDENVLLKPVQ